MKFKLKYLNKGTFKIKYLLLILVVIYLPIAINGWVLYNRAINIEKKDRLMIVRHMMDRSVDNMHKEINTVNKMIKEQANHNGVQRGIQVYAEQPEANRNAIKDFLQLRINETVSENQYLDELLIISTNGEKFQTETEINLDYEVFLDYLNESKIDDSLNESLILYYRKEMSFLGARDAFISVQPINILNSQELAGYFIAIFNIDKMLEKYDLLDQGYNVKTGLYIQSQNLLFSDDILEVSIENVEAVISEVDSYEVKKLDEYFQKTFVQVVRIPETTCYFVSVVKEDDLLNSIKKALQNNYLLLIHITLTTSFVLIILFLVSANIHAEKDNAQYRYIISEELNQKLRIYKHDFMNHLQVVQALIELDYKDKAIDYIRKLASEGNIVKYKCDIGIPEIESTIFSNLLSIKDRDFDVDLNCIELKHDFNYDTFEIVKVISNLIRNAVQALSRVDEENKKISVRIYRDSDYYYIDVKNSHPLIPVELQERVFEKGYSTNKESGRGLGLFIVNRIVEKNNGQIKLTVDESGNEFSVKLPI